MLKIEKALLIGLMSVGLTVVGTGVASASCPGCSDATSSHTGKQGAASNKQGTASNKQGTASGKVNSTCRIGY